MAKKKDSTALFEVISKTRETQHQAGFSVPTWMGTDKQPDDSTVSEPPPTPKSRPTASKPATLAGEPIVSTAGGRLSISLSQRACLAVAAGLVVLMALMFVLGRVTADDSKPAEGDGPQKAGITNGNGGKAKYEPVAGKYYLLIQKLKSNRTVDRNEAERVMAYLKENRLDAWIYEAPDGYAVFSTKEYDKDDRMSAAAKADVIERVCKNYVTKYSPNYKYRQPRDTNGQIAPELYRVASD